MLRPLPAGALFGIIGTPRRVFCVENLCGSGLNRQSTECNRLHVCAFLAHVIVAHNNIFRRANHLPGRCGNDLAPDIFRCTLRSVAVHEGHTARIRADIDRSEVRVSRHNFHSCQGASEHFGHNLRNHGVRSLADIRCSGVHNHAAIAINLDIHRRMRHIRTNNRVRSTAYIVTATHSQTASAPKLPLSGRPF